MYIRTWLLAIAVAALSAGTISFFLPNSADEELARATAAQMIVVSFTADR